MKKAGNYLFQLLSLVILLGNVTGIFAAKFSTSVTAQWWTWLVTIEPEWMNAPAKNINLPFLVAFFTCVGLNASWTLVKRGTVQILLFLGLAALLAVIQNVVGVSLAKLMGVEPLLGLVCGSVSMTGGHGNVLGFAGDFERAGLHNAAVVGVAAATFGLVTGGLLGGPVGGGIIQRRGLQSSAQRSTHLESGQTAESGILRDFRALATFGKPALAFGEGGSIPFMGMLGERFPKAQFVVTGVLGPASNAHGPNEFLHIPTGKRVTEAVVHMLVAHHHRPRR